MRRARLTLPAREPLRAVFPAALSPAGLFHWDAARAPLLGGGAILALGWALLGC
jgi:hypothetical protein